MLNRIISALMSFVVAVVLVVSQVPVTQASENYLNTEKVKTVKTNGKSGEMKTNFAFVIPVLAISEYVWASIGLTLTTASLVTLAYEEPRLYAELGSAYDKIPDEMKDEEGKVDLGQFEDKYGRTAEDRANNSSGEFTWTEDKKWTLERDRNSSGGHGGSWWKLKHPRKNNSKGRVATLDKAGRLLRE